MGIPEIDQKKYITRPITIPEEDKQKLRDLISQNEVRLSIPSSDISYVPYTILATIRKELGIHRVAFAAQISNLTIHMLKIKRDKPPEKCFSRTDADMLLVNLLTLADEIRNQGQARIKGNKRRKQN